MGWAAKRRMFIILIAGSFVAAIFAVVFISVVYKTPTCTDDVQNQAETGIDCGGPCPYLCSGDQKPPAVLFTKVLHNEAGRTDVVALVRNQNASAAALHIPYRIALYDKDHKLTREIRGGVDLPPGMTVPIYVSEADEKIKITEAFLTIDMQAAQWFYMTGKYLTPPTVSDISIGGTSNMPRVNAIINNESAKVLEQIRLVAVIYDSRGNVVGASQTMASVPAHESTDIVFTWNNAFAGVPSYVRIYPVVTFDSLGGTVFP